MHKTIFLPFSLFYFFTFTPLLSSIHHALLKPNYHYCPEDIQKLYNNRHHANELECDIIKGETFYLEGIEWGKSMPDWYFDENRMYITKNPGQLILQPKMDGPVTIKAKIMGIEHPILFRFYILPKSLENNEQYVAEQREQSPSEFNPWEEEENAPNPFEADTTTAPIEEHF